MIAYINDAEVELFEGARIGDAVLAYSKRSYKMLLEGKLQLTDRFGFITEPDGPLQNGQKLSLKRSRP